MFLLQVFIAFSGASPAAAAPYGHNDHKDTLASLENGGGIDSRQSLNCSGGRMTFIVLFLLWVFIASATPSRCGQVG